MAPLTSILGDVLLGIDHVGIAVADLDAAVDLWCALGLTVDHRERNEEQGVDEVMLALPDGKHLQLLGALSPDSAVGKFLARSGQGLQQLAFTVTDIDAACAALEAAGLRLVYPEPRVGTGGSRINFIHPKDATGVLVELVESVHLTKGAPPHG